MKYAHILFLAFFAGCVSMNRRHMSKKKNGNRPRLLQQKVDNNRVLSVECVVIVYAVPEHMKQEQENHHT